MKENMESSHSNLNYNQTNNRKKINKIKAKTRNNNGKLSLKKFNKA